MHNRNAKNITQSIRAPCKLECETTAALLFAIERSQSRARILRPPAIGKIPRAPRIYNFTSPGSGNSTGPSGYTNKRTPRARIFVETRERESFVDEIAHEYKTFGHLWATDCPRARNLRTIGTYMKFDRAQLLSSNAARFPAISPRGLFPFALHQTHTHTHTHGRTLD